MRTRYTTWFVCTVTSVTAAHAEIIFTTGSAAGAFGYSGFNVCNTQPQAVRFSPDADYTLNRIALQFVTLFDIPFDPAITVSVRLDDPLDDGPSVPSETILEEFHTRAPAAGSSLGVVLESVDRPLLEGNEFYWIVVEGAAPCGGSNASRAIWAQNVFLHDTYFAIQLDGEWLPKVGTSPGLAVEGWPVGCQERPGDCNENDVPDACEFATIHPDVDCCTAQPIYFCPDFDIVACVCAVEPDCCLFAYWGPWCAEALIEHKCGACVQPATDNDCNDNGLLDECDLAGGSTDYNASLVPDECEGVTFADADDDGDVDLSDWSTLLGCYTGPQGENVQYPCTYFDRDTDGDVDLSDTAAFQLAFTVP